MNLPQVGFAPELVADLGQGTLVEAAQHAGQPFVPTKMVSADRVQAFFADQVLDMLADQLKLKRLDLVADLSPAPAHLLLGQEIEDLGDRVVRPVERRHSQVIILQSCGLDDRVARLLLRQGLQAEWRLVDRGNALAQLFERGFVGDVLAP